MLRDTETTNVPFLTALTGALRRYSSLVWLATPRSERLALHPASTAKNGTLAISASLTQQHLGLRRDAGISSITLLFWLMVLVMGTVVVIKVIPVYYEYWSIVSAVKSQAQSTDAMARSREVRESLMKRLDVADIHEIDPDEIYIERDNQDNVKIDVKYTRKVKIIGNVSLSFDFDVSASGAQAATN